MDDLLEKKLMLYKEVSMKLYPSEKGVNAMVKKKYKKTKVAKRIMISNIIVAIFITIMVPATTYAAYQVTQILYEKVKNGGYTQEEIIKLDTDLKEYGFGEDDISNFNELQINENGLTYGPDALGADLIEVISEEGKLGYIYREDLEKTETKNLDEALNSDKEITIQVYDKDGETKIGIFVLSNGSEAQ